jgi:hypothetical protein
MLRFFIVSFFAGLCVSQAATFPRYPVDTDKATGAKILRESDKLLTKYQLKGLAGDVPRLVEI